MKTLIGLIQRALGVCPRCDRPIAIGSRKGLTADCSNGCCDGSCAR